MIHKINYSNVILIYLIGSSIIYGIYIYVKVVLGYPYYNTGCTTYTVRIRTWVPNMDTPVIY